MRSIRENSTDRRRGRPGTFSTANKGQLQISGAGTTGTGQPSQFSKKKEEKAQAGLRRILESALTTGQKIHLINTNIIPAVVYVTANIAPDEKRATTIKRCRDLDTKICSMLVDHKVKG